jgi:hypothetical protein
MQSATDMTNLPGFQSHNTLPRYYLMVQDLEALRSKLLSDHTSFEDSRLSLLNLHETLAIQQRKKFVTFINVALDAIDKHFIRSCNKALLPAALLSERELATVVALVMTNQPLDPTSPKEYWSPVHSRTFDRSTFHEFLVERINNNAVPEQYEAFALRAADLLLGGSEFRDKLLPDPIKHFMYSAYLPLASHTQFVEAGVKEAKIISCTDRSEPLRSAYAVNRSANVHNEKLRTLTVSERVQWLLQATKTHVERQEALGGQLHDYTSSVDAITGLMRKEHFKEERVKQLQDDTLNKLNKNKMVNATQQRNGVDRTHAIQGLFPYGKLVKKLHFDALKTELLFRGCSEDEVNDMDITRRKNKLKELECDRFKDWDNVASAAAKEMATRAFRPLSGAQFPVA